MGGDAPIDSRKHILKKPVIGCTPFDIPTTIVDMIKHPNFSMSPTVMKVAENAEWERAKIFRVEEYTGHAQISSFVQNREEIACEAFFKDTFFGLRRRGSPQEILRFVQTFADITTSAQSGD